MTAIVFTCEKKIALSSREICEQITQLEMWSEFGGYAFLPAIKNATYHHKTADMIGTCIKVENTDNSSHTETIYKWNPEKEVAMKFGDFSPPLSQIATHFTEEWTFETEKNVTFVKRTFSLFPKSAFTKPLLWLISLVFRKAVDKHLAKMAEHADSAKRPNH